MPSQNRSLRFEMKWQVIEIFKVFFLTKFYYDSPSSGKSQGKTSGITFFVFSYDNFCFSYSPLYMI